MTVGVAKAWATATARPSGLPQIDAQVIGADLAPLAGALGVVVLAAFGAVIATRGWVRRWLGVLIVVAALVVLVSAVHPPGDDGALTDALSAKGWTGGDYDSASTVWRWVTMVGAIVSTVAGVAISRHGGRWATMGAQYDAPVTTTATQTTTGSTRPTVAPSEQTDAEVWRDIDEGRDPTRQSDA